MPSGWLSGAKANHANVGKHDSLRKTSAEAAGVATQGLGRRKTIVWNFSLRQFSTDPRV